LRFSSHRDFQRALERAIRRADIPIAYSAGFSPHPRISYANSAPTGTASEAEYVEIAVVRTCDPDQVRVALDHALPPGLDVIRVVEAADRDLGGSLQASEWRIELPGLEVDSVTEAVALFLAASEVEVERLTKNGVRRFDARGAVAALAASAEDGCAILIAVIRHETPSVRPDDLLSALRNVANLVPPLPPRVTRLAQGPYDPVTGQVGDPFAAAPVRS
jgi:radical SAM-linked protein